MRWVKFALSLLLTLGLLAALLLPIDPLPTALGKLLDPHYGFWQNAVPQQPDSMQTLNLPGLKAPVRVVVEARGVPHIFAENDHDLYLAQGYFTAQDRLWEMDFMTRAVGGELAAVLGAGPDSVILNQDRRMRRKGMVYAAERSLELSLSDPKVRVMLEAFADGVNAYLGTLGPQNYPIEFKLLDYAPPRWSPLKTYLLFGALAEDLTGSSSDLAYTRELMLWGRETFDQLHPEYPYEQDPILPENTRWPRLRQLPVPPTPAPEQAYDPDSIMMMDQTYGGPLAADEMVVGSNNWAVDSSRSTTGAPLLANDPHLGLNLPSIWHEVQLQAPGVNVYGVTVPGIPGVVIGFNDSVSWGMTNASFDVLDHFRIFYTGPDRRFYYHDGQERPVAMREEKILVKGGEPFVDSVRYTHHGPVMYDEEYGDLDFPVAIQWTHFEPSNTAGTLYYLNRADSAQAVLSSVSSSICPSQSIVFADVQGQIGIVQAGRIPNRWPEQGRFLLDGRLRAHDWTGFVPFEMMPQVLNPEQGYIGSANQQPTAEESYPYYYTGRYEEFRSRRLYDLLAGSDTTKFSLDDMASFQLDNYGLSAADVLPLLLSELDSATLTAETQPMYEALRDWDYAYEREQVGPTLFEEWFGALYRAIWLDEYQAAEVPLRYPDRATTIGILLDSVTFRFYDTVGDTVSRDRRTLINQSFEQMAARLIDEKPEPAQWQWQYWKQTDIRHLSRVLTPFSREGLPTDGNSGILNATSRFGGPSWRMLVSMERPVVARGVYPGGQSGNPGSEHYDDFIEKWQEGDYFPLWLMASPNASGPTVDQTISLQPAASTEP